ncbi:MAG: phospholipase D family protein [Chromatiaceae bacterium]|nr:phospholipase D family protein [Chromatiaceae bacterium]MBP6733650.1 phospholipase D family protein [Chromatiaceae bacterium]MBP6807957.1 phospholipase D family protein [Chromatiaceae bacterium]MBP8288319.1 phospholipase D family protein [Chromatiaceae bacterium]
MASQLFRFTSTLALALVLTGCASLKSVDQANRIESLAIADPETTPLGKQIRRLVKTQPAGQSGFLLLDKGEEALLWRGMLADQASRTIDAQYFIWYQDNVGRIAAERLLRAAERGVRVRVIVDEISLDADPRFLAFLNDHPQVEIRLYNPVGALGLGTLGKLARIIGSVGDFPRLNRRMHNKTFIVDGSVAILGGRNVADEYYDLDREFNFRDLDVLALGPVVPKVSSSFDEYWNHPWVVPLEAVVQIPITPEEREAYYRGLHQHASQPGNFPPRFDAGLAATTTRFKSLRAADLHWGQARIISDRPGKNPELDRYDAFGESGRQLTELALGAQRELLAATPYLIMLPGTYSLLEDLRERDVRVAILTNSMAANDAIWVHSRYAFQRRRLLGMGIELFEYRGDAEDQPLLIDRYARMPDKVPLVLHAKTLVIDRQVVYIGSFNMDPRSTHLNTEIGLIIESPPLAQAVAALIERDMAPHNSWRLELTAEGRIEWVTRREGKPVRAEAEPDIGVGEALKFLLLAILPIGELI